jgi:hypothetical protein
VRGVLDLIVSDYNNYTKARIQFLQQQVDDENENIILRTMDPMPVKTFQNEFKETLQREVIEKSVKLTANVAIEFLFKLLNK